MNHKLAAIAAFMALFALLLLAPWISVADIYRWVDKDGRVHYSEVVPPEYVASAVRVDVHATEPSQALRQEAASKVESDLARAARMAAERASAAPSASLPAALAPGLGASDEATGLDCATRHRLYQESVECFAPYRTVRGATKAEAFEKCTPVMDPAPECGPPKQR